MKRASKIYTALVMIFLFAPIAILLVFSFNSAKSLSVFDHFSLYWYRELFRDAETLKAVRNTLVLAVAAALISTAMGTAAAVGINRLRIYGRAENLFTWTKYWGFDPEIGSGSTSMGVDYGVYPQARTFTIGLNLSF